MNNVLGKVEKQSNLCHNSNNKINNSSIGKYKNSKCKQKKDDKEGISEKLVNFELNELDFYRAKN